MSATITAPWGASRTLPTAQGTVKGPILRGLASRTSYFHDGSAATLTDVVRFYDRRFGLGLTEQQVEDLAAFPRSP